MQNRRAVEPYANPNTPPSFGVIPGRALLAVDRMGRDVDDRYHWQMPLDERDRPCARSLSCSVWHSPQA
jgi:hypothetical protein